MRIGTRISVGFLSFSVLLVLVLSYEYAMIQRVVNLTQRLSTVDYELGQSSLRLRNDLALVEEFTAKFFSLSEPEPYASELDELLREISQELARLLTLEVSDQEHQLLEAARDRWETFSRQLKPWLEQGSAGADTEVAFHLDSEFSAAVQEFNKLFPATRQQLAETDQAAHDAGQEALQVALLAVLIAVIMGPLATFLIVRSIMNPIETLTAATRRLASGDFKARIQPPADEDMANLARDFNSMVRDLQELEQHKKEFFSAISHELKAPLASMQETTSVLLEGLAGELSPKQSRMLQLNQQSGRRLMRLLNNILDYSRLEAGALRYEFLRSDSSAIVRDTVEELGGLIHERQSRVEMSLEDAGVELVCDPERLLLVFRNLLDNALKYSPPESLIRIEMVPVEERNSGIPGTISNLPGFWQRSWVLFRFRDQAPQVVDSEREQIFRRYHQTEGRPVRSGGVGLGLAISQAVVRAHDGFIWVEPDSDGGNCFSLLLSREGPRQKHNFMQEQQYV